MGKGKIMDDNIKTISTIIAQKLALQKKAVILWVETNNYELLQLNILAKQIHYNEIYIPTLVDSIIHNNTYRISIY